MAKSKLVSLWRRTRAVLHLAQGWFPEKQIFFRTRGEVSFITLSRGLQIGMVTVFLAFCGWVTYTTVYYLSFDWILRDKNVQIAEARIAYSKVMEQVASHNERLMSIARNLETSQRDLLGLLDEGGPVAQDDGGLLGRPGLQMDRVIAAASHRALTMQIQELEVEWMELTARNATLEMGLASIGNEVESILSEHEEVKVERDRLLDRLDTLELRLASMRKTQDALLKRMTERTDDAIANLENVVIMAGLDVETLIESAARRDNGANLGVGGPFIAFSGGGEFADDPLDRQVTVLDTRLVRFNHLQNVLANLPLIPPVDHYRLSSGFGPRRDPVNARTSQHYGIDLAYHSNTPIYATAPGRVAFAGWRGGFGRVVEINHGMGVRTRYGHLRKILVKRGQQVNFRDRVALMGSSGRSTGTHLHYEVLVDGTPQDPLNFINAGKYVYKDRPPAP